MDGFVQLADDWREHGWFSFPRQFARDRALSWEARGLAAWMASHDPGFRFDLAYILRCGPGGRDRTLRMLRELIDVGYLVRVQARHEDGTMGANCYQLHPARNPRSEPRPENPVAVAPAQNRRSAPRPENPATANPGAGPSYKRDLPPPPTSSSSRRAGTRVKAAREEEVEPETTGQVLDDLPAPWGVGPRRRAALSPLITAAVAAGWSPARLREYLSANPDGVKNGYAVMRARLLDLPPAPRSKSKSAPTRSSTKPAAPKWCGTCREIDRMIPSKIHEGRMTRCPACNPREQKGHPS